jgi:hypothetical protein
MSIANYTHSPNNLQWTQTSGTGTTILDLNVNNNYIPLDTFFPVAPPLTSPVPFNIAFNVVIPDINIPPSYPYNVITTATFTHPNVPNQSIVVIVNENIESTGGNGYTVSYLPANQTVLNTVVKQNAYGVESIIEYTWIEGTSPFTNYYNNNDIYIFYGGLMPRFYFERQLSIVSSPGGTYPPSPTGYFNSNQINLNCNTYCSSQNEVRVPIINIVGQTTYNQDYLSDMTFYIQDKYKYYDYDPCIIKTKGCCEPIYMKECKLKKTTFLEYAIPLQDVVKGKGCTLREKLLSYYNKHSYEFGPSFDNNFYVPMIEYSMLKYILAKLIYGNFDIKYLCRDFNKQFFKDLKHTRFCGFIQFFKDNFEGFEDYFIKCC